MTTTINKEPLRRINAMKNIITIALEQTDEEIFSPIRRARDRCGTLRRRRRTLPSGPAPACFKAISRKSGRKRRIAQHTNGPSEIREFQRSKKSFTELAQNEDWLANNFDKIIHSQDIPPQDDDAGTPAAREPVAESEERILLRCLGAAVIMQWNTIPTKPARTLRYRRLSSGRAEIGGTESTDCPLPA
jgi:hypothetical protein